MYNSTGNIYGIVLRRYIGDLRSMRNMDLEQQQSRSEHFWCVVYNTLQGLSCMHSHNICHNDVKPGNILLADAPIFAVLTDMGAATATGDVVHTTTYRYQSVSMRRSKTATCYNDLRALAHCVLRGGFRLHGTTMHRNADFLQDLRRSRKDATYIHTKYKDRQTL